MKRKILVIDDDDQILAFLKKMLEQAGFDVELASDGNEGIKRFKKAPSDLVITDIIMPGKEGLETIQEMRGLYPELKIIAMSGGGRITAEDHLKIAQAFGANKIIEKPFSSEILKTAVTDLLEEA